MDFQEFKKKYEKVPVEHYSHKVNENPEVSVCVQTYNHAPYIKECLNGILMQQTDFPIEILLGEDSSKDGTREICIDYAEKYPDKIRLFLHHRENNIQIGGQPTGRFNFLYNLYNASGQYIALCEGDDYWTDPLKLQKQVDFLETNNRFSLICTDYSECDSSGTILKGSVWGDRPKKIDNISILRNYKPKLLTTVFNSQTLRGINLSCLSDGLNGDNFLFAIITRKKPAYYLNEVTGVYRITDTGIWSGISSLKKYKNQYYTFSIMLNYFKEDDKKKAILERLIKITRVITMNYFRKGNFKKGFKYAFINMKFRLNYILNG